MAAVLVLIRPRQWRRLALVAGFPLLVVLALGEARLQRNHEDQVRVALGAIDALQDDALQSESQAIANAAAYADLADRLAAEHPEIILFPEKALIGKPDWPDIGAEVRTAADRLGAPIVVGIDDARADGSHDNAAMVYRPRQAPERYLKRHLIPGLEEGFNVGTGDLVLGPFGVAICKDMDFAPTIRSYSQRGIRLMLVPAWDFRSDADLHARMAVVRGVEGGFAVARAAANGLLTVSDPFGRIVAARVTDPAGPVMLTADVALIAGETLYDAVGDLFGWLCVGAAALLVGQQVRRRLPGRTRRSDSPSFAD